MQPNPSRPCRCQSIDARLTRVSLIKTGQNRNVFMAMRTELECTNGSGGCHGTIQLVAPRMFRYFGDERMVDCPGGCGDETRNDHPLSLSSGNSDAGEKPFVLELRFTCEGRSAKKRYTIAFTANGTTDILKSDLDGNGILDYKETRKP